MALDLKTFLPYRLANLATKMSECFAPVYQNNSDLTTAQWRILFNLAQYGQSHSKALCEQASMDKSTVSRAVKALIIEQYVQSSANPDDKRTSLLMLTAKGKALYEQLAPEALLWEKELLAVLDDEEYQALVQSLNKISAKLTGINKPIK